MRQSSLLLIPLALLCGIAHAQPKPAGSPADFRAMILAEDQSISGAARPILDAPRVSDADKDLVRKAFKPVDDALADIKKDGQSLEQMQAAQTAFEKSMTAFQTVLKDRPDLDWVAERNQGLQQFEASFMQSNSADFAAFLKEVGVDDATLAKSKSIIDTFKTDFDGFEKQAMDAAQHPDITKQMAVASALSERTIAAIKDVYGLLTPAQQFQLDWCFIKGLDEPGFMVLTFASQPGILQAPEDGAYLLQFMGPPNNAKPKELASVTLKKGDPIGFKKDDKTTTAIAGEKTIDLAAQPLTGVFWQIAPKK